MTMSTTLKPLLLGLTLLASVVLQSNAWAYSYAAAGKEPLIEGRETIINALAANDFTTVTSAVAELKEEFDYLLSDHNVDLSTPMQQAIAEKSEQKVEQVMDQAVVEEIIRRLDGAEKNLGDYQVAKVLVVKSKLFLDLIMPKLSEANRTKANSAIQGVLASIGNPGVFGVGQAPADPAKFASFKSELTGAISGLQHY
ncbi:hypothetical protein [Vibrio sp. SCSIO 43137]|uniref:hypothetical protein n=1 Tax=Vibrio sp. SCSIO 43137 TaxID=3021011 RepID=UPI002307ECAF|nr:hypothetical protein [Vibrio sp. SCSIO 43137]WCE32501.1 hypothetical protein PK654_18595 [Vibrio sp. SCSIO 43137]